MRRVLMVLLALATAGVWVTGGAAPAGAAALPTCDGVSVILSFDFWGYVPSRGFWTDDRQCNLRRGSGEGLPSDHGTRQAVRALQESINICNTGAPNRPLKVDGLYGPKTTEAVAWIQSRPGSGLEVDGQAGPLTRARMNWVLHFNGNYQETACIRGG